MAKCENRVSCDLALRNELIEMTRDGRCPECGQALHVVGAENVSATDDARRNRSSLMLLIGGGLILVIVGVLAWALIGNDSQAPSNMKEIATPSEAVPITEPIVTPRPADVIPPITTSKNDDGVATTPPPIDTDSLVPSKITPMEQTPTGPSLETQQHVKQGMVFVSLSKQNPATRGENIKNALVEFDAAVKSEDAQGRCYASAYMNRGIAYWQDQKFNLAERDLLKASVCNSADPIIFYNLASYYSAMNKPDLALEPLDKALSLGFNDCDILRKDTDLNNLRKLSDFRRILESHQLFCLK